MKYHRNFIKTIYLLISLVVCGGVFNSASAGNIIIFTGNGRDQTKEVQALLSQDGNYQFHGVIRTKGIQLAGRNLTIDFAPGAVWEPIGEVDKLFSCHNCNLIFGNLNVDGQGSVQQALFMQGGTLTFDTASLDNIGSQKHQASDIVSGMLLAGVKSINGGALSAKHINAIGNGIFGDNIGAARAIDLMSCGTYRIDKVIVDWTGSDAEEADSFQTNIGNAGGTIGTLKVIYNGNTRRCAKYQSGVNVINFADISKASDFRPVSEATDAGKKNFNCISWEADTPGSLDVMAGKVDASGFVRGIGNNAPHSTAAVRVHSGVTLTGATKPVIRTDPQTGRQQHSETFGFYTGNEDKGSGIEGAKVINFSVGALLRCKEAHSSDTTYENPSRKAIEIPANPASNSDAHNQ